MSMEEAFVNMNEAYQEVAIFTGDDILAGVALARYTEYVLIYAAEKIRSKDREYYYENGVEDIWNMAADLIDPEVENYE